MKEQLLITCYHHVGVPPSGAPHRRTWVSGPHLARHLELLVRCGYSFQTVSDALARPQGRRACITFDDGFADVMQALPVLTAFGATATFYVVTDEIGRQDREWDGGARTQFATEAHLTRLAEAGWEIGSHADTHVRLAGQSASQQHERLARSRARLERVLGTAPSSLAYPYASYDAETVKAARAVGFTSAVRLAGGFNGAQADRLQLNRISLCGHRFWEHLERLKLYSTHRGWYPRHQRPALCA